MSKPLRFALCSDPLVGDAAFQQLAASVAGLIGLALEPVFVSTYAGLAQALESGDSELAWLPPVVAQGLYSTGIGRPIVTAGRSGRTSYYSVLLARSGAGPGGIEMFADGRIGWVSKLSAAGYVVPSLYLRASGFEPDELFAEQSFMGTHSRVLAALGAGEIDLAATYAQIDRGGRTFVLPANVPPGSRVVVAAGPIPGDVIFASDRLAAKVRDALRGALLGLEMTPESPLARLMSVDRFEVATFDHFARLREWQLRARETPSRITVPPDAMRSAG